MRINPIGAKTNYYQTATPPKAKALPKQENTTSPNLNYLNTTCNQAFINFKGISDVSKALVRQIPLEDKLASIFQNFKLGDMILIGKNLKECARQMYQSAAVVKNTIKRGFFIPDENLGGSVGFILNSHGDTEVINLNNFEIPLISKNKTYSLKPHDSYYVLENDILSVNGNPLGIKKEPRTDLSMYRKNFAIAFDFEKEANANIEKINKKTLSQLMQPAKKRTTPITFAQVGGLSELKDSLKKDIIYPIRYPEAYQGIELNHGFILYGPPGTGKTHIARALANEAEANFINLNGLDLESKWVGESEANWRNLFEEAKQNQPTIIFLDEFDAVARSRDSYDVYGNKVVNQILTLMSDIDNENCDVYVIAATNNYKSLDSAITRSGRFGKHYEVTPPDKAGLKEIFKINTQNRKLDENINIEKLIDELLKVNATGADIRQIVNEAHKNGMVRSGIYEKMDNKTFTSKDNEQFKITQEDFEKALNDFLEDKKSTSRKPIGFMKQQTQ